VARAPSPGCCVLSFRACMQATSTPDTDYTEATDYTNKLKPQVRAPELCVQLSNTQQDRPQSVLQNPCNPCSFV